MKKIINILYNKVKQAIPILVRLTGVKILSKQQTLVKLNDYLIEFNDGEEIQIPPVEFKEGILPQSFSRLEVGKTSSIGVYCLKSESDSIKIFPYGGTKLNANVLDMDFGSSLFINTLFKVDKRPIITTKTCIILWSHQWGGGYYDYLFFIYSKLLVIKETLNADEFANAKIAYPLFGHSFEIELLKHAGVEQHQIVDTNKLNPKADFYYLSNNDSWYYHNRKSLFLLKKTFLSVFSPVNNKNKRIYISRKGRRKLSNENEVVELLKKYNFTIIEDKTRPVAEQISIYKSANIIIGPHGASFSNIICCETGTTIIELFARNYYPSYFRYIATVLNLKYFIIVEDNVQETHYSNVNDDISIDPLKIKIILDRIISDNN